MGSDSPLPQLVHASACYGTLANAAAPVANANARLTFNGPLLDVH